jgi:hypothetical protein
MTRGVDSLGRGRKVVEACLAGLENHCRSSKLVVGDS